MKLTSIVASFAIVAVALHAADATNNSMPSNHRNLGEDLSTPIDRLTEDTSMTTPVEAGLSVPSGRRVEEDITYRRRVIEDSPMPREQLESSIEDSEDHTDGSRDDYDPDCEGEPTNHWNLRRKSHKSHKSQEDITFGSRVTEDLLMPIEQLEFSMPSIGRNIGEDLSMSTAQLEFSKPEVPASSYDEWYPNKWWSGDHHHDAKSGKTSKGSKSKVKCTPKPTRIPTDVTSGSPSRLPSTTPTVMPTSADTETPTAPSVTKCGIKYNERRSQIVDILSVISFPDLFEDPDSPQRKALDWIIDKDESKLCPGDSTLVQRYTLVVFYYSTNGDDWKQCNAPEEFDNQESIDDANAACKLTTVNAMSIFPNDFRGTNAWLTPESECLWGGLSCYSANTPNAFKVNAVEFDNNGLSGTLPEEMEQLKMRFFALDRGSISGPIPSSSGNLQSLLLLDLDSN